jgi:guanylate kinase
MLYWRRNHKSSYPFHRRHVLRPGEQDGREYHFTTVEDFIAREKAGEFLEHAEVHGNYYGTSRLIIEEQMRAGTDVLLEIDWQGAQQVRKQFPGAVGIFILPPSIPALEERLKKRGKTSLTSLHAGFLPLAEKWRTPLSSNMLLSTKTLPLRCLN